MLVQRFQIDLRTYTLVVNAVNPPIVMRVGDAARQIQTRFQSTTTCCPWILP
jgi:hypothetical protein